MTGEIVFYLYHDKIELLGNTFTAGELTEDFLNCDPESYAPMHEKIVQVSKLERTFEDTKELSVWLELNEELIALSELLCRYKVFDILLKKDSDLFRAVREAGSREHPIRLPEVRLLSELEMQQAIERGRQLLSLNEVDETPEPELPYETKAPSCFEIEYDPEFLFANGFSPFAWRLYQRTIQRYRSYLHDLRAFNGTIRNFIKFALSKLRHNCPENYAGMLYAYYNDSRIAQKLIVNPRHNRGDRYRMHELYQVTYVPRLLPDGSASICQENRTDSLQALLQADYMLCLNSGYNIRRCLVCGRYFLLKSGVHALYCENTCPYDPRFTCRQFGTVEVKRELARDVPKLDIWRKAHGRITKDMQRGNISREAARMAKDYARDLLYDAMRDPDWSLERFEEALTPEKLYTACFITRTTRQRGRPPKEKAGDAP